MEKRFRLRISRAISTTLQSCRSKHPSILPLEPVPSLPALKINAPAAISSACLYFGAADTLPKSPEFEWRKEEKWHVVAKNYDDQVPRRKVSDSLESNSATPPAPPPSSDEQMKRRGRRNKKKINVPSRLRLSTSSADSGWFTSEGGGGGERLQEETETLVSSSIGFSTDSSSDLNPNSQLQPIRETQLFATNLPHRLHKNRTSCRRMTRATYNPPLTPEVAVTAEAETPTRLSVFKKLIPCTVEGKVKESYAIVKRSEDPYKDFKNSMVDMILEKQMFDPGDLEQLLQCFLSLNSAQYHGMIVEAFSGIWEAIFAPSRCCEPAANQSRRRVSKPTSF